MRLSGRSRRKVLINVTSLIDVVFLLLLFFVVTSTFLETSGLDLTLPEAGTAEAEPREDPTVRLTAEGGLYVGERAVPADSLAAVLRGLLADGAEGVILEADERVEHGRVVAAMDAARDAGAEGITVGTRPEAPPAP